MEKYLLQCRQYAQKHYRPVGWVTAEDVVQEMAMIIWQSYTNGNGVRQVLEKGHLLPQWQLRKIFLNALRNLRVDKEVPLYENIPYSEQSHESKEDPRMERLQAILGHTGMDAEEVLRHPDIIQKLRNEFFGQLRLFE